MPSKPCPAAHLLAPLEPLIHVANALGCATVIPKHERVSRRLAEYAFFRAGGILVGTHAFLAYGNMLGVPSTLEVKIFHSQLSVTLQPVVPSKGQQGPAPVMHAWAAVHC